MMSAALETALLFAVPQLPLGPFALLLFAFHRLVFIAQGSLLFYFIPFACSCEVWFVAAHVPFSDTLQICSW